MRSFDATQLAVVAHDVKSVSWLFDVGDVTAVTHYWSTKAVTAGGHAYTFKVVDFSGVSLSRPKTESGIIPPSELSFTLINKDNVYAPSDFENCSVTLRLYIGNGTDAEVSIRAWKFLVKRVDSAYQTLQFTCEDFFSGYLDGNYPGVQYLQESIEPAWDTGISWDTGWDWASGAEGTALSYGIKVKDIFPGTEGDIDDDCCIPLPFGTCYIPVRSAYITDDRFYVLGPTVVDGVAVTYTITACRTPREYSAKTEYTEPANTFTQYTKQSVTGYSFRTYQAIIPAGGSNAVFENGDQYYDLPTEFSRSDTSTVTNPADVVEYLLTDIGVASGDIDSTTFASAHTTYDTWTLEFAGAFWETCTREEALLKLLSMCHATLIIGETIEMRIMTSASQKTVTSADIICDGSTGPGSFSQSMFTRSTYDCGNLLYSPTGDSQDLLLSSLVSATNGRTNIDSDTFEAPFISDATIAGNLAKLWYQRKLFKKAEERFSGKATLIGLDPGDFITITGNDYGGSHVAIVDSMKINKDVSIEFVCTTFSDTIQDYGDL